MLYAPYNNNSDNKNHSFVKTVPSNTTNIQPYKSDSTCSHIQTKPTIKTITNMNNNKIMMLTTLNRISKVYLKYKYLLPDSYILNELIPILYPRLTQY